MKALLAVAMVVAVASMTGCAPQPLTKADVDGKVVCNVDYMDQVERQARRQHWEVRWVNCPQAVLRAV
jgi:hypothetical protein